MAETKAEIRDRLRRRYVTPARTDAQSRMEHPSAQVSGDAGRTSTEVSPSAELERAFVVEGKSGRVTISGPAHAVTTKEVAGASNKGFLVIDGRFVEADTPNRNGAFWSTSDLELGQVTVAGGPLNWLHDETSIIGSLVESQLVYREAAAESVGTHIRARSVVWRFLHPDKAQIIETASANNLLWYSMECVSENVQCLDTPGRPGCGEQFPYMDYVAGRTCAHLKERSSVRRLVEPTFLGGAVIVPPVQPGWANASATVQRQAAELAEREHLDQGPMNHAEVLEMASAILNWANREV